MKLYQLLFLNITGMLIYYQASGQTPNYEIYEFQEGANTKIYWEYDTIKSQETMCFLNVKGQGVINKFWCSTFPETEQKENNQLAQELVLKIYWDGSEKAAVSVPIADFFCQPLQLNALDNCFFNSTNELFVFNSMIPMPFRQNAKMEIVNLSKKDIVFFYGLDLEFKNLSEKSMYLHSYWQHFRNIPHDSALVVLPQIKGQGRYLGTHIALKQKNVLNNWPWYTRPTNIFIDKQNEADKPELLINTLDDYIGSGWWDREPKHEAYDYKFTGRPLVDIDGDSSLSVVLYRYHVQDPLWFQENVSFTIGENWNFGNQDIGDGDWSTTSFFYLNEPANLLPDIKDVKKRTQVK